jgi:hypothetical protein
MMRHVKLAELIAALLVILLPSFTLAQDFSFSISPAEVHIDNLSLGEEGRAEFPDDSWISFSSQEIEVAANSAADVTVTVAIPLEQQWAGGDWEIWLGAAAESSDLLAVRLYVRLLVSTSRAKSNAGLIAGIIVGTVLLGWGGYYYFRRKAKPE